MVHRILSNEHSPKNWRSRFRLTDQLAKINNLRNNNCNDIKRYLQFMKLFAEATYSLEGDQYTRYLTETV